MVCYVVGYICGCRCPPAIRGATPVIRVTPLQHCTCACTMALCLQVGDTAAMELVHTIHVATALVMMCLLWNLIQAGGTQELWRNPEQE